jgi:hypothetical protein
MKNEMYPELVKITPRLAEIWLEHNTENRKLRVGNAKYYQRLIEAREFQLTHQGLAFTGGPRNPGRLLDGQTRLTAIINSGIPCEQWVFWNSDERVFEAIDSGAPRSFVDRYKWPKEVVAIVNILWKFANVPGTKPTKTEADKIRAAFGKYIEALLANCPTCRTKISCAAVRAAAVLTMYQHPMDVEEIAEYYRRMVLDQVTALPSSLVQLWKRLLTIEGGGFGAAAVQFPLTHKAMTPANWNEKVLRGPKEDYFKLIASSIRNAAKL